MEQFPEIKAARERAKDQNKVRGQRPNNRTRSLTRIKRPWRAADGEKKMVSKRTHGLGRLLYRALCDESEIRVSLEMCVAFLRALNMRV